jgi:prepilin-type N-terminal cleavage/methylation domain-containing protein/prepilin-type processing-associated H-X9-DG protein
MNSDRSRFGFTLIELLVVIAVITILTAILFPVFAHAREKARQMVCLSNLKQIGTATMLYAQDFDETYPGGGPNLWYVWVPGPQGSWENMPVKDGGRTVNVASQSMAGRLLPYAKDTRIFFCPNYVDSARDWDTRFTRLCYGWLNGLSNGITWPTFPGGKATQPDQPLSLAGVSRPALLQMAWDLESGHTSVAPGETRRNVCFADGHAKFTRVLTLPRAREQSPWLWNQFNPRNPLHLEAQCSPTCREEAARVE